MTASLSARPMAADILAEAGRGKSNRLSESAKSSTAVFPQPQNTIELPDLSNDSKEESEFRAYFLAMAIANNHRMMLSSLIERLGMDVDSMEIRQKMSLAIKVLTGASLFMIGLESGGITNNESSMYLLIASLKVVEGFAPGITVKQMLTMFGDLDAEGLNQVLCREVVEIFSLDSVSAREIGNFVCTELSYRREISGYACRQCVDLLKEQLALFV